MAPRWAEGLRSFCLPPRPSTTCKGGETITKAQEIYEEVNRRVASGVEKADAFKALADEASRPYDSVRGSYYSHKKKIEGGESRPSRTRRRETTPEDALADARAALERAVESIDREVESAEERATEAAAEAKSLKASAAERKKTITERLEALK
jgi:predicted  nucleic acid-binding Zn-ribbon protein